MDRPRRPDTRRAAAGLAVALAVTGGLVAASRAGGPDRAVRLATGPDPAPPAVEAPAVPDPAPTDLPREPPPPPPGPALEAALHELFASGATGWAEGRAEGDGTWLVAVELEGLQPGRRYSVLVSPAGPASAGGAPAGTARKACEVEAGADGRGGCAGRTGRLGETPGAVSVLDGRAVAAGQLAPPGPVRPTPTTAPPTTAPLALPAPPASYRAAGQTGYIFAGNQEAGFYDRDGAPCLLYRRLDGPARRILADACPARAPDAAAAWARLLPAGVAGFEGYYLVAIVTDRPVTAWTCTASTGEGCGWPTVYPDPAGSGRSFLADFAGLAPLSPGARLTAVLLDGPAEVGRVELVAP